MYRVSPFTYFVSGMLSTSVANAELNCAANEYLLMQPPAGATCGQYLGAFVEATSGSLLDANATVDCRYCPATSTNSYLESISVDFSDAWRNFGIVWAYIIFNVGAALFIYWLARVPKKVSAGKAKKA